MQGLTPSWRPTWRFPLRVFDMARPNFVIIKSTETSTIHVGDENLRIDIYLLSTDIRHVDISHNRTNFHDFFFNFKCFQRDESQIL